MTSQILTIRRILEGVNAKNLEATTLFVDFAKAFDSMHRGKVEQILLAYSLPKETVAAIMMLYRNTKVKVCSPVLFLIIQFNISHLFAHSFNVKQFYLTLSGATTCRICQVAWGN